MGNGWLCAALACVLVLGAASSAAAQTVRQVLVLQSFDRGNLHARPVHRHLPRRAGPARGDPVNVIQVVVGPTGFVGASEEAVVNYIRAIFADTSRARPHPHGGWPRGGIRTHVSATTLSRYAAPVRSRRSALSAPARHLGKTKPRSPSTTILRDSSRASCSCCPGPGRSSLCWGPDQSANSGVHSSRSSSERFHDRLTFVWSDDLSLPDSVAPHARACHATRRSSISPSAWTRLGRAYRGRAGVRRPSCHGERAACLACRA